MYAPTNNFSLSLSLSLSLTLSHSLAPSGTVINKAGMRNSTSDSDLIRCRSFSKSQQSFGDSKPDPCATLPHSEIDIIAPCKLVDRTHNVTEKFTQVSPK